MASDVRAEQDPKAFAFNCAQRGAHNPLESYPMILSGLVRVVFYCDGALSHRVVMCV